MKTRMFLLAAAAAALAGCAQNEVIDIPQTRAIGFDPYVGNTTRAAAKDTDLSALKAEGAGFIVLGGYEDGQTYVPVFDGTNETGSHITWNKSSWEYSPINYWLEGKTYKFVAYPPAKLQEGDLFDIDYAGKKLKMNDGGTSTADGETDPVKKYGIKIYTTTDGQKIAEVTTKTSGGGVHFIFINERLDAGDTVIKAENDDAAYRNAKKFYIEKTEQDHYSECFTEWKNNTKIRMNDKYIDTYAKQFLGIA